MWARLNIHTVNCRLTPPPACPTDRHVCRPRDRRGSPPPRGGRVPQVFSEQQAATSHVTAFDLSSSAELLAFGDSTARVPPPRHVPPPDRPAPLSCPRTALVCGIGPPAPVGEGPAAGLVHTWGRKEAPMINAFSDPTDQPINGPGGAGVGRGGGFLTLTPTLTLTPFSCRME